MNYKVICKKCGKEMKKDETIVYMSYPPQYLYKCECGHTIVTFEHPDVSNISQVSDNEPSVW